MSHYTPIKIEQDSKPNAFESMLIEALLAGDDPLLESLRKQYAMLGRVNRELTGSGIFLNFEIPESVPRVVPPDFHLDDVYFDLDGLEHGCAILWVKQGAIAFLEGYSHDGKWPAHSGSFEVHYFGGERDLPTLLKSIRWVPPSTNK